MSPRTPLLRPDRYFAERDLDLARVAAVFVVVVLSGVSAVYGIGYLLVTHVNGTVMVDNPERPPEMFCDDGMSTDFYNETACNAPKQVEQNIDPIIWDAIGEIAGPMFVGMLLLVAGVTVLLHLGSWFAGGTNGLSASFGVAVWGTAPIVFVMPVSLAILWITLDPVTISAASAPEHAFEELTTQLHAHHWIGIGSSVLSGLWSATIWRFGLEHERNLTGAGATVVAGMVALLVILGGML